MRSASAASRPKPGGTRVSILARSSRASTGAAPPEAIATCSGARDTTAGVEKPHREGRSTTL
jgi:hypothetical protein